MHFTIAEGFVKATTVGQMGWFFLMAVMYITGAGLYAARIPERFFPGKFDIWVSGRDEVVNGVKGGELGVSLVLLWVCSKWPPPFPSFSHIRSSMCSWWPQPLSTSTACPTSRSFATDSKGGAQTTLCSESAWF